MRLDLVLAISATFGAEADHVVELHGALGAVNSLDDALVAHHGSRDD